MWLGVKAVDRNCEDKDLRLSLETYSTNIIDRSEIVFQNGRDDGRLKVVA